MTLTILNNDIVGRPNCANNNIVSNVPIPSNTRRNMSKYCRISVGIQSSTSKIKVTYKGDGSWHKGDTPVYVYIVTSCTLLEQQQQQRKKIKVMKITIAFITLQSDKAI
ncbi:hypothetical protein DERP_005051 [Dermatophagoides pteronyssinus]|uniref:Uncharacterized protein n=1 Tax=Dermatophagoides pteronyssinus TaxID=6956 RepID=A0ABQ8JUC1_DERPT|nr:hypothetical protein DERP_005051 [Dermatophagoides pteronyssinus]